MNIVDISLSGIGIVVEDNLFANFLRKNTRLKVYLNLKETPWFSFIGYIKRIVSNKFPIAVGIEIHEILPINYHKLQNFINDFLSNKRGT